MSIHIPYIDTSVNAQWDDWQNYPEGRPNPMYSKQVVDYNATGLVFGFITLSSEGKPCWASQPTMPLNWSLPLGKELKAAGKKVAISFGGAAGSDISTKYSVEELIQTYSETIEMYKADQLDFDLENGLFSIDKITEALKSIQSKYPTLILSFTLPILPTGLIQTGLDIVIKAKNANLNFMVNGMAMDYYQGTIDMGEAAIKASKSLKDQLSKIYPSLSESQLYAKVAITPMIGLNDDLSMFTIEDATKVSSFAKQNNMGFTSSWSLNRDNPSSFSYVDLTTSSNPSQKKSGEYTETFVNANK